MDEIVAGKIIAEQRKDKGLTQKRLAELLGVTDKAVSRWENGYGLPDVSLLPKIAEVFGITVDELLTGRRPLPPSAETPVSLSAVQEPPRGQSEIGQICDENRRGLFRLRLRQVTQNEFTLPFLFVYLALFFLCMFFSPLRATVSQGTYYFSPLELIRSIFDKTYANGYFFIHISRRLETFMSCIPFLSVFQSCMSLALLIRAARGNRGGGMKAEWFFALVTALGALIEGICIPFVNRFYGIEKYDVPPVYGAIIALGVLQLMLAYAVSCHRKPKRRIKIFSFVAAALTIPFFAAVAVSGHTQPAALTVAEKTPDGGIGIEYYRAEGYNFAIGCLWVKTNRTVRTAKVKDCLYVYDSGARFDFLPQDVYMQHYKLKDGYATLILLQNFFHYPPNNQESGEVVSLSFTLDMDGKETAFSFNSFTPIANWTREIEKAEAALQYEQKFSSSDF